MKTYSNRLLIATTNPGKLNELKSFLSDLPIEVVDLKDLGITQRVEETGKTFEENAILKAKFYQKISGLPTLADDGGFEIDTLDGEPGVKSHRWIDPKREATDEELIEYTITKMRHVPLSKRGAQLRLVLALVLSNGEVHTIEDITRGVIPFEPAKKRTFGFPYRALLFLPSINKFYDQDLLTDEESTNLNHRRRAIEKLKPIIRKTLTV